MSTLYIIVYNCRNWDEIKIFYILNYLKAGD